MNTSRHCYSCGTEYKRLTQPGRGDTCEQCGADLRVCLNCVCYDPSVSEQCRERQADYVAVKDRANYCEFFQFTDRPSKSDPAAKSKENEARERLKRLFGD
jgi:hypothetical protein